MSHDLFISHSSGDADVARALRSELEAAGYTCWLAPDDVVGNDPWAEQILAAIGQSRAMIVLISERSSRSHHVSREVSLANGRGRVIVPIRIEHVAIAGSLEYHLEGLQRIDAFPPPITNHMGRILRRLALLVPPEASASVPAAAVAAAALVSSDTEVVRLPAATSPAAPAPVAAAARVRSPRPRWVPPSTGVAAGLLTMAALIVLGAGVVVFGPNSPSPTGADASTTVVGSPAPSQAPASVQTSPPFGSPSPEPGSPSPSSTTVESIDPDPTPTRTPRTDDPPPPTKPPKPPTAPPPTTPPVNDTVDPTLSGPPTHKFVSGGQAAQYSISVKIAWSGSDSGGSGLKRFVLEQRSSTSQGGGSWQVVYQGLAESRTLNLPSRISNQLAWYTFRVTARDNAGNSTKETGRDFGLIDYEESSGAWSNYSSGWSYDTRSGAIEGQVMSCSSAGETATLRVSNVSALAFVFTTGSSFGSVKITVDGQNIGTFDLSAGSGARSIVKVHSMSTAIESFFDVVITTQSGAEVELDAVFVQHGQPS